MDSEKEKNKLERADSKASNSTNESAKTEEEEEEDVEPVLTYNRMKNSVLDILKEDFASCMCVSSKVISK